MIVDQDQYEVKLYTDATLEGQLEFIPLCDDCLQDRVEEETDLNVDQGDPEEAYKQSRYAMVAVEEEDEEEELAGVECEDCTTANPKVTEAMMERAVDAMCDLIGGTRTSAEVGSYEDRRDRYMVEVEGRLQTGLGVIGSLGGWVELDEDRDRASCLIGVTIDGKTVGDCEAFVGEYDFGRDEWEVAWDTY